MASLLAALLTILSAERRLKNAISFLAMGLRVLLFYKRMVQPIYKRLVQPLHLRQTELSATISAQISAVLPLWEIRSVSLSVLAKITSSVARRRKNAMSFLAINSASYYLATRSLATALSATISARKLTAALLYPILCTATS